jgi:subtilisin family serine protease
VEQALREADAAGVLVVVSAGNEQADLDERPSFPACSAQPNVLAVAGTDAAGDRADFSNFGASCVDLAAPATGIVATRRGGGYEERSGTSMAAPQVAGAAVLLLAARPELTPAELHAALVGTAVGSPRRLNVRRALGAPRP